MEERFIGTLTEIMRTSDSDSNLVVSHGTTIDVFLRKVIGDTEELITLLKLSYFKIWI